MNQRDYNALLYEKMAAEYNAFLENTAKLPPQEILDSAYQKVIKEDILSCFSEVERPQHEAKALYQLSCPLDACYQEWLKNDYSYMDMLRDTVDDRVKSAVKEMREKQRESR